MNEQEIQEYFYESDVSHSYSGTSEEEKVNSTQDLVMIQLKIDDELPPFQVYQYIGDTFHGIRTAGFIPGFAFIQFFKNKYAIDMLDKHEARGIDINGHHIQVKRADCNYVPYEMYKLVTDFIPTVPIGADRAGVEHSAVIKASPKDISIALNYYCLLEILSQLSWVDLISVSQTCKSLQQIAEKVFKTKFKNTKISLYDLVRETGTITSIEYFLKNFGALVSAISMDRNLPDQECGNILRLIGQYCTNIKTFSLCGHGWMDEPNIVENNAEWFGRLENVGLVGGFLAVNSFLNTCTQLKVLVGMMIDCLDLTHVTLPHLTEIDLSFFKCRGMGDFIIRHPHVEVLKIEMPDPIVSDSLSGATDQFIFQHLPNIRYMEISREISEISDDTISRLCEMRNLKSLYLDGVYGEPLEPVMEILSSQRTIETLRLANWIIDSTAIEHICKMKSITAIIFERCRFIRNNQWTRLIYSLPQLKEIVTMAAFIANMDAILPTLKRRRIKWVNTFPYVSYDPRNQLVLIGTQMPSHLLFLDEMSNESIEN